MFWFLGSGFLKLSNLEIYQAMSYQLDWTIGLKKTCFYRTGYIIGVDNKGKMRKHVLPIHQEIAINMGRKFLKSK